MNRLLAEASPAGVASWILVLGVYLALFTSMVTLVIAIAKGVRAAREVAPPRPPPPRDGAPVRSAWVCVSRGLVVVHGPSWGAKAYLYEVAETCERMVDEIVQLLEIKRPNYGIHVYLSDEYPLRGEVCGFAAKGGPTAGPGLALAPYTASPDALRVLAHELCHVLAAGEWPSMRACVLHEGLAELVSQRLCGPDAASAPRAALLMPLRLFAAPTVFYEAFEAPRGAAAPESYAHAHAFVRDLIASRGLERFKLCCGAHDIAAKNTIAEFSRAVRDVYGESIEEIEAAWREAEKRVDP